ncbi:MAG: hypothetical protein ACRESS_01060 [Stenotrophobium sp.]
MYEVIAIANEFIARGQREGLRDLSAIKLHALVYLVCCYWMARGDAPPLRIHANREGVFLPDLREHGCWGTRRVANPVSVIEADTSSSPILHELTPRLPADHSSSQLIDWVWHSYRKRSAYELSQHTREHGTPWDQVWNDPARGAAESCEIPQKMLHRWFAEIIQQRLVARHPETAAGSASVLPGIMPQTSGQAAGI